MSGNISYTPLLAGVTPETGTFNLSTTDGVNSRLFLMQVPSDYTSSIAYPLTFVFHGLNGDSSVAQGYGLQTATGASEASIFVFPNGHSGSTTWDDSPAGVDFVYFDNMLAQIKATYNIDPTRIFIAGFSYGGDFATSLVVARGDKIRAAIINSCTFDFSNTSDFTTHIAYSAKTATHPAVRFEHAIGGDSFYSATEFSTTSGLFQSLNGCSGGSTSYPNPSGNSYESCVSYKNGVQLTVECPFTAGLGHILPSSWVTDAWAFLARYL
jgi:poly(3-hydroxybutyrate) depolymerase